MPIPNKDVAGGKEARCAAQHFGPWMVEPAWFTQAVAAVKSGTMVPMAFAEQDGSEPSGYEVDDNGIAQIGLHGQMTKGASSYGGASTVAIRRNIREAVRDDSVKAIFLHVDSPGGTVAGTADLATEVNRADAQKPVYAYIEDLGASAAYWVASQARRVTANPTAQVGCIGTLIVLEDSSGKAEKEGLKVRVVSSGGYKGAFVEGTEITEEQIDYAQGIVNDMNIHLLQGVKKGRNMPIERVRELADGRLHIAAKALSLGLIDGVETIDDSVENLRRAVREQENIAKRKRVEQRLRLAESALGVVAAAKPSKATYRCECLDCDYQMDSEKHCRDIRCPKCDGEMRRIERPGPGHREDGK